MTGGEYRGEAKPMATPWADLYATFDPNGPDELTPEEQAKCRALERRTL